MIFQVSVWQLLTRHVIHPSVNIANLSGCYSNKVKFLIMVSYTILTAQVTYVTSKYHLKLKIRSPTRPACTFFQVGTGLCTSFYPFLIC